MKCLTICEPFASAIVFGGKDIENRRSRIPAAGPCIIHAGKSLAWYEPETCAWLHERWPECPEIPIRAMHRFQVRHGRAIGVAWFGEPFKFNAEAPPESIWATGPWCLPVLGVIPIEKPFALRGQQGVFHIPSASLPAEVHAAVDALAERCSGGVA